MRRAVFTLLLCSRFVNSETDEMAYRLIAFEAPYNTFLRAYFGCPPDGEISRQVCLPHKREIRRGAYVKAREAAKVLFDLREK